MPDILKKNINNLENYFVGTKTSLSRVKSAVCQDKKFVTAVIMKRTSMEACLNIFFGPTITLFTL